MTSLTIGTCRNCLISLVFWVIAYGTYPVSLVTWAVGHYKHPRRLYRLLGWLEGQRVAKCRKCGFWVKWSWNFCPGCGGAVQETFVQEIEEQTAELE